MDYQLPEELRMLQETVRRFVDRELIPIEQDSMDGPKLKAEVQESLEEKAKAIGLWLFDVPEEYGGQGLGLLARSIVWTELARTTALPTRNVNIFGPIVSPILYYLNEEQKKRYLFPVLEGKLRHCFAQTERRSRWRSGRHAYHGGT